MTNASRISIVPLSEVPAPVSSIKVGSLEAVLMVDDSVRPLKSAGISYEVLGLPRGQKAWIVKENEVHQVIRQMHGESEWLGKYSTTEEALRALATKLA